jgi:tetratricopeptide (TPR) repeat protein
MEACWLLALVVSPLFFDIYSSRVFEPDKVTLVRSLALVTLAACGVKLIVQGGIRFEQVAAAAESRIRAILRQPLVIPVSLFCLTYLLSTFLSVAPSTSWLGSYQRLQGTFSTFSYVVLFAAVAVNMRRRAQVERVLTTVIITSLPVGLYGILQRYHLDPLPWGGDTVNRVTGNLGNAIFIGAYLIMPTFAALGRVVTYFRAILTETENLRTNVLGATLYVFILAVDLIAIYFCNSRGPWLGLLAGLFFFFVMLALHWRINWLGLAVIALAAAAGGFLLVLNIPSGPLQPLRETPALGRISDMLGEIEGKSGTGQVRVLIWDGVVQLMSPHTPLAFPDGHVDPWNSIRPLVGYGPEGLYVAFNRFYPPQLGQIEARNASPDRSHNETFDALAFTGVLGLCTQFALFVSVFYYALKWAGLVGSERRRAVFLVLVLGGGVLVSAGLVAWQGPQFFGVGLPLGLLVGLIGFLTVYALVDLFRRPANGEPATAPVIEPWRGVAIISLLAAVVAHYTEIHFGIAIAATRTHFWIFTGVMMVVGFGIPASGPAAKAAAPNTPAPAESRSRRRGRPTAPAMASKQGQLSPAWITAGLMTAVLITLGYDYITNPLHSSNAFSILAEAFTALHTNPGAVKPFGILGLMLVTWLVGSILIYLEESSSASERPTWQGFGLGLWVCLLVGLFSWMLQATQHAAIAAAIPSTQAMLLVSTDFIASLLTTYYVTLLVVILAWAAVLAAGGGAGPQTDVSLPALVAGFVLSVVALVAVVAFNLKTVQADIIYKTGLQFDGQGQPQVAVLLFQHALEYAPNEDYYYLFLGRSYLNLTSLLTDANQRETILQRADSELITAQGLNPLNTDHTANLARLNSQWAVLTSDPAARQQHIAVSSQYYAAAVKLSPNNVGLWVEWAKLTLQLQNNITTTQTLLTRAFDIDTTYEPAYQVQGDLFLARARATPDAAAQAALYKQAVDTYQAGLKHGQDANIYLGLATVYEATNQLQAAIDQYQQLVQLATPGLEVWRVEQRIANLYVLLKNPAQAQAFASQALAAAPQANKADVQAWMATLPK